MSTTTKEQLIEDLKASTQNSRGMFEIGEETICALMSLLTTPPAPVFVPEWTNKQCLEFLSIAFRHAEIKGDLQLDDIRLGVKMVNGSRAAMLQGADGNSPVIPDGWVACSERMPEQFKAILAFNEYGEVWSGAYDRYWNFYCDNLLVEHVTHWMPLPAAPQQEA